MPLKDPIKRKEYQKKYNETWFIKNRTLRLKQIKLGKTNTREWFIDYKKNLKCKKCGESTPCCLDFHHTKKNKDFSISGSYTNGYSIKTILKEIKKCIVLCANCHRKHHQKERDKSKK